MKSCPMQNLIPKSYKAASIASVNGKRAAFCSRRKQLFTDILFSEGGIVMHDIEISLGRITNY